MQMKISTRKNHFRRGAIQTINKVSKFSIRQSRQQDFANTMRQFNNENDYKQRPLGQLELYSLNDKVILKLKQLEISSDDEDQTNHQQQNYMEQIDLPFDEDEDINSVTYINKNRIDNFRTNKKLLTKVKSKITNYLAKKELERRRKLRRKGKEQNDQWLFHSDGYYILSWNALCMILIFYEVLTIPFKLSFDVEINPILDQIIDIVFMTDIVFNFNTSIYKKGLPIYNRKQITLNYLSFWFWIDLLASFPYDTILDSAIQQEENQLDSSSNQASKYTQTLSLLRMVKFMRFIKVIRLLRLAKLKVFFDKLDELIQPQLFLTTIISFIKLCGFVLFWSHWLGCIFHYIAVNEDSSPQNLLHHYDLQDKDWSVKYINFLYWGVTTMNTVGYGDISPQTPLERAVGIFFLMIATVVFSITLNSIGTSLQGIEDKKQEIRIKINQITKYMKQLTIPNDLQSKIKKYLNYVWEQEAVLNLMHLTDHLSFALKIEFEIQAHGAILGHCLCLRSNFSRKFLKQVTRAFKQYTAFPDEFIVQEFETTYKPRNLYFIQSGIIHVTFIRTNQKFISLEKNEYFGEISFFTDEPQKSSAQSADFTSLVYVDKEEFLKILKDPKFKSDLEIYQYIKDEIIFENNYSLIQVVCYSCLRDDHTVVDCPNLHFHFDRFMYSQIKQKYQQKVQSLFERKDRAYINARKHNSLVIQGIAPIQNIAKKFLQQQEECNLNESSLMEVDSQFSNRHNKFMKPPRFGPFRSRFRDDKKKFRKMKSQILEQDQQIQSLKLQQNISEKLLQQLSKIITKKNSKQIDELSSAFQRKSSRLPSLSAISGLSKRFKNEAENDSSCQFSDNLSDFHDLDSETDSVQNRDNAQIQLIDILQRYTEEMLQKEEENLQIIFEKQFSLIPNFDVGTEFQNYYPKYNQELMIEEYNKMNKQHKFRPQLSQFYENDFFTDMREQFDFGVKDNILTQKFITLTQIKNFGTQTIKSPRQEKMSKGTIKLAKDNLIKITSIKQSNCGNNKRN